MEEMASQEKKIYEPGFNAAEERINNIYKNLIEQQQKYKNLSDTLLKEWKGVSAIKAKAKMDKLDKDFSKVIGDLNEMNNDISSVLSNFQNLDNEIAESYSKGN